LPCPGTPTRSCDSLSREPFAAQSSRSNPCTGRLNSYDCQAASNDQQCCLWARPNADNENNARCVAGYVRNDNGWTDICAASGTFNNFQGTCAQTSNCPGILPALDGTWYYPAQCGTIGGQFNVVWTSQTAGTFTVNATQNQSLRIPSYNGAVDVNGNIILTQPGSARVCTGSGSSRTFSVVCPGSDCVTTFYRSAANAVTLSIIALVACLAFLALF